MLAFSTQVRGFKSGRNRRSFKGEKILSTPTFEREVKPLVSCRRFATCKRSPNGVNYRRHVSKITGQPFSLIVPPFAARISCVVADVEAKGGNV